MTPLRIAFFGTPQIAVYVLEELEKAGIVPALVVTSPDRPKGRNLILTPPPVKVWTTEHRIECIQPETYGSGAELTTLHNTSWDLFVVAAHGRRIPKNIIDLPKHGTLNVHPSLLPRLRGPSPIRSAILTDERETGVTIMKIDEKIDHGPIVAQESVELREDEWPPHGLLFDELLARAGGALLAKTIPAWVDGTIEAKEQDHENATYCKKITKDMGEIDLKDDSYRNFLKIRGLEGWPGTYFFTEKNGKRVRVKILDAELDKNGKLVITRVVPEGRKEMSYDDFARGQ